MKHHCGPLPITHPDPLLFQAANRIDLQGAAEMLQVASRRSPELLLLAGSQGTSTAWPHGFRFPH